jgi:hypothetical protein
MYEEASACFLILVHLPTAFSYTFMLPPIKACYPPSALNTVAVKLRRVRSTWRPISLPMPVKSCTCEHNTSQAHTMKGGNQLCLLLQALIPAWQPDSNTSPCSMPSSSAVALVCSAEATQLVTASACCWLAHMRMVMITATKRCNTASRPDPRAPVHVPAHVPACIC